MPSNKKQKVGSVKKVVEKMKTKIQKKISDYFVKKKVVEKLKTKIQKKISDYFVKERLMDCLTDVTESKLKGDDGSVHKDGDVQVDDVVIPVHKIIARAPLVCEVIYLDEDF